MAIKNYRGLDVWNRSMDLVIEIYFLRGDYLHHLSMSSGSLCELETQLIIAGKLKYVSRNNANQAWILCQETGRMLASMQRALKNAKA